MISDNRGYNFESNEKFFWNQHQALTEQDEILLEEVIEILQKNPTLDLDNMQISVERGHLTLQGEVQDDTSIAWIDSFLEDVPGVLTFENNLRVVKHGTGSTFL
ncbi:MAG: BON domain-containing protein [Bacteriovoracaceae bacterium]